MRRGPGFKVEAYIRRTELKPWPLWPGSAWSLSCSVLSCKRSWQGRAGGVEVSDPSSCLAPSAIRPEGKNNRLFVFSISMASVAQWSLDVAADSQEELQDWVKKIREVAQTADARVRACSQRSGEADMWPAAWHV